MKGKTDTYSGQVRWNFLFAAFSLCCNEFGVKRDTGLERRKDRYCLDRKLTWLLVLVPVITVTIIYINVYI